MPVVLELLQVRPVLASEEARYRELMQEHHYLGDLAKIGHTLWYVATQGEQWAALLSFSAAAWKCGVRDRWIGWDFRHQFGRLRLIANNIRPTSTGRCTGGMRPSASPTRAWRSMARRCAMPSTPRAGQHTS